MTDNDITVKNFKAFYDAIYPYLSGNVKIAGPVGMIISYMGTTAPSGYLACDGSWYDIGLYPKLANWMMSEFDSYSYFALSGETVQSGKFKVPDLRGEFLRGTGTNAHANQGSGANVGTHQDGTEIPTVDKDTNNKWINVKAYALKGDFFIKGSQTAVHSGAGATFTTTETDSYSYTSRPTNTSVLYCIKYEEYEGDGRGVQYSTEEQVIGTWIDGKPLYQKTVNCGALPNATTKNIAHGISNLNHVINYKGWCYNINGIDAPLLFVDKTAVGHNIAIYSNKTNIIIETGIDRSDWNGFVTLQYTKTT